MESIDHLYRDDVRVPLDAAGWRETGEDTVVAENGAMWTEVNDSLDSGIDGPGKAWSVAFDSNVPGVVIVAAALAASGVDVPALALDNARMRAEIRALRREAVTARDRYHAGLSRADEKTRQMNEELQRYADGKESPVLWSVYNRMHKRAATAEGRLRALGEPIPDSDGNAASG